MCSGYVSVPSLFLFSLSFLPAGLPRLSLDGLRPIPQHVSWVCLGRPEILHSDALDDEADIPDAWTVESFLRIWAELSESTSVAWNFGFARWSRSRCRTLTVVELDYGVPKKELVDDDVDASPFVQLLSDLVHLRVGVQKSLSEDIGIFVGFGFDIFQLC